jgi:hypothetical protein
MKIMASSPKQESLIESTKKAKPIIPKLNLNKSINIETNPVV